MSLSAPALQEHNFFDLRGLNLYDPDETADVRESPSAKNFRLYAPKDLTKRTAVSKRKGHIVYTVPVGETIHVSQTTVTGAADQSVGLINWVAMKFTTSSANSLSRIDLNLKNASAATGNIMVEIRPDSSGSPSSTVLATSSIRNASLTNSYQYLPFRFMEAPALTTTTDYWIVAYIQNDGSGNYQWSSTTAGTLAKTSSSSGNTWSTTTFSMDYKMYYATTGSVKGLARFYRSTAAPVQVFAHISDLYSVNDNTGAVTSIKSGLNSGAAYYDFETVNNKLYYVNGLDAPRVWDGTTEAASAGSPPTSNNVELHANRLFYLSATDPNRLVYSDAAAYETFQSVSFIYIPSPNTKDPAQRLVAFQGNLTIFTRNRKYTLFGTDLTSFTLRETAAKKGCTGPLACVSDGSYIYFLSDDGVYRYNGGNDQLLSKKVQPIIDNIADKTKVEMQVADNKLFVYYRASGQAYSNNCVIYDLTYNQWLHDTNVYIQNGTSWTSQSDTGQIIQSSSLIGALYYADNGYNDMGKPISFEYRTIYHSFGHPSAKHRVKRLYPHLRGEDSAYNVDVQVDVDEQNAPISNLVNVNSATHLYGEAGLLYGTAGLLYGNAAFAPTRITVGGANRKHQIRFVEGGADRQVDILGYAAYVQQRRPV